MGCWINQSLHTYKYLRHKINDTSANASFSQANIHSIMDAEPQVESLMQLLNDALKELDHLDTRLTGYDTLLRVSSWELIPSSCIQHGWNLTLLLFCQHDNVNYSVNAIAMIGPLVSMAYTTNFVSSTLFKVYMTWNFLLAYSKEMKNGIYFIVTAFFVAELFKVLVYAN